MYPTISCCTLTKSFSLFLCLSAAESYSVAGSDGSIPPSAGSVPHQASGSSSPCSHASSGGSRHPVSALKKWLTNPVRKLSSDVRGGAGKVEKQMCRSDRRQPSLISQSERQLRLLEPQDNYTILPSGGDPVRQKDRHTAYIYTSYIYKHILYCCLQRLLCLCYTGVYRRTFESNSSHSCTAVLSRPVV